jgi:hypothetical protein
MALFRQNGQWREAKAANRATAKHHKSLFAFKQASSVEGDFEPNHNAILVEIYYGRQSLLLMMMMAG